MDNVLLGKVLKAMYKLSGKTLAQLSDETGLTVDNINNLFYARVQKPGYIGVSAFCRAAGFTSAELAAFLEAADELPPDADITERFVEYLREAEENPAAGSAGFAGSAGAAGAAGSAVKVAGSAAAANGIAGSANSAKGLVKTNALSAGAASGAAVRTASSDLSAQLELLNTEHEKQLDRYRATHLYYVDQLKNQYEEQIDQLETSFARLKEHYDHSVGEIKKSQAAELDRVETEVRALKRMNIFLTAALIAVAVGAVIIVSVIAM